jgi:hypothetical protein
MKTKKTIKKKEKTKKTLKREKPGALPSGEAVLVAVSPRSLLAFWEAREARSESLTLRVYKGSAAKRGKTPKQKRKPRPIKEIEVSERIGSRYIEAEPSKKYIIEVGKKDKKGRFTPVLGSKAVKTPPEGPSEKGRYKAMLPEKYYHAELPEYRR